MKYSFENDNNQSWILYNINSNTYSCAIFSPAQEELNRFFQLVNANPKNENIVCVFLGDYRYMSNKEIVEKCIEYIENKLNYNKEHIYGQIF